MPHKARHHLSAAKLLFWIRRATKQLWWRAFLYAALGFIGAIGGAFVRNWVPDEPLVRVGSDAVGHILDILATSMLTVATFSLSIMVMAFGNVARSATPRATRLMVENQRAQRAIATFIGGFLYAIVGCRGYKMISDFGA